MPSKGFIQRTTTSSPQGITIKPPAKEPDTRKHYVGGSGDLTEEEALAMGYALYDQITADVARNAQESS